MHYKVLWSAVVAISFGGVMCNEETYDYVVVGAGTSGLILANRLSADPNIKVALIDPGGDERDNPIVQNPTGWTRLWGSHVDWNYQGVPQANLSSRVIDFHAGKGIGGTSLMNGMTYIRGDKAQFDAWEELGNTGWDWDTLYPYYKHVEQFHPPQNWQTRVGATAELEYHGTEGEVQVGFPLDLQTGSLYSDVRETWGKLGHTINSDLNSGTTNGFSVWPQTIDPNQHRRCDAATAFLWPVSSRKNLHLLNGTVSKVLWNRSSRQASSEAEATGVEYFVNQSNRCKTVKATREVILSAGALRTPLILERSGVGNPGLLEEKGIETVVNLPGVGENLIDQPNTVVIYTSKAAYNGTTPYVTFATAEDLFGGETSNVAASTKGSLRQWAVQIAHSSKGGLDASALERVFEIQHRLIFENNVTISEILTLGQQSIFGSSFWPLLPFSRGSVHVQSAKDDDVHNPVIDPKYLSIGFDTATQSAAGRLATKFWHTSPISGLVDEKNSSNSTTLPLNATDAQWQSFIQASTSSNSHSIGTAAMMAKDLGGVVNPAFKVYGTSRLRVVDASVLPMQFSGHMTATLYAVADRAAEFIQSEEF